MTKQDLIYEKLCDDITDRLDHGVTELPTESSMCKRWTVSRQTLRAALGRLKDAHIITSRRGSGYVLTGLYPGLPNRVAILIDSNDTYTRPQLLSEVIRLLDTENFQAEVFLTGADPAGERAALQSLLKDPPRGLLSWVSGSLRPSVNAELYTSLEDAGTRIIFPAGRCPNVTAGQAVLPDDEQGGYALTRHLLDLGHTQIGCILLADDIQGEARYLGHCRALFDHGLSVAGSNVVRLWPDQLGMIRRDRTSRVISGFLGRLSPDLTAIFCQSDELSFYTIRGLAAQGIRVPSQISVAGFDDSHLRYTGRVTLTTMRRRPLSEAQAACSALLGELRHRPGNVSCSWQLVRGGSCAAAL